MSEAATSLGGLLVQRVIKHSLPRGGIKSVRLGTIMSEIVIKSTDVMIAKR